MLATETYVLDDEIETLSDRVDELEATLEDLDEETDEFALIKSRRDRVIYLERGLRWQRDEVGWPGEAELELGAMTAGEEAMMHREAPANADRKEMRLWFVAASTIEAPYADGELEKTFRELSSAHPAFVEWAEAKANSLGIPSDTGNRSSTSSKESEAPATSTDEPDSTTSSSSDSPTA